MNHIFDSIHTSDMISASTGIFSSLSPVVALILGILLAMIILSSIVSIFTGKIKRRHTTNNYDEDDEDDDFPY